MAVDFSLINQVGSVNTFNTLNTALNTAFNNTAGVQNIHNILSPTGTIGSETIGSPTVASFRDILDSFMSIYTEANEAQLARDRIQIDFATGRTDNILDVMMAQERALATLSFSVQVTSRIIEAYREIIRMQM